MHNLLYRKRIYDILVCLAMAVAAAALIVYPQQSIDAARDGLTLCTNVIIPSLFPFFVLSTLVVQLGIAQHLGRLLEPIMRPLFGVGGACSTALVLGFIGGYPVGAKTVISLYENGTCTKAEAERLLSFCNNSGPAFIFGVVGAGVFASSRIGLLLYAVHMVSSLVIGFLFRKWGRAAERRGGRGAVPQFKRQSFPGAFTDAVRSSFQSTLNICGFVIFFTVFIKLLFAAGIIPAAAGVIGRIFAPLGFDAAWAERLLTGIIELSSGVWSLQGTALTGGTAMAAFMLGWAGLSVHSQVLSFVGVSGLSVRTYIYGKLLQSALSVALVFLLSKVLVFGVPASSYLAEQVTSIAGVSFGRAAVISCAAAIGLLWVLLAAAKRAARRI